MLHITCLVISRFLMLVIFSLLHLRIQVHRPHVGTDPFSTELVLERGNADWFLGSRSPNLLCWQISYWDGCRRSHQISARNFHVSLTLDFQETFRLPQRPHLVEKTIEVGKSQKQDVSVSSACIAILPTNSNIGISAVCVLEIC